MIYLLLVLVFFGAMLVYFRVADHYSIIDKPNERSSHSRITIRGGGIIFLVAALAALTLHPRDFMLPAFGVLVIGTISFLDDVYTLSNRIRIVFHITAVTLMFLYLGVFTYLPWYMILGLYVLVIGIINAYNFMDGINGITGAYSLVVLGGLQYVNYYRVPFVHPDMLWLPMLACVVFLFFNFRKKAKCFAGDVGSVTIAFWVLTLLLKLILQTGDWSYLLFLAVYGIDAVLTILHRLLLRQNIFKAHRLHFYQILANEKKVPHLVVSSAYAALQALVIVLVISGVLASPLAIWTAVLVPLAACYTLVKPQLMTRGI
ncbi:UDP-GlcNAc--UDP-phosphate GlcNAc-1-phosphate transferase [Chitinophaga parva]|uniref:UDP-GlcNAc--UDP-phosphate GlcNAc-1-phosphate transferase n=1 Tax=Chitinophaga parva TaxID=2169414 RepID=A0A2T7BIZ3_9BACT|nr:glycosyltransferase family 4 protein [Chitinophaga parva]PUZ26256.1 UDP-GlcNAc--UDP-phosphate GlcNAc-1-phosphate transferase [Chitinophaga parva]